jgi:hypothetical protein
MSFYILGVHGTADLILIAVTGGPKNVIPGAIMFSLFGAAGQALYNSAEERASVSAEKDPKLSWLNSKWSPVKVLSEREYEEMLREKLLKVNAEIALVDESIAALRVQEREMEAREGEKAGNDLKEIGNGR